MKVLVSGFSSGMHCEMILGLAERSFEIVYWVAKKRVKEFISGHRSAFRDTIFHDYIDALAAIPAAGIDCESFEPVGRDIIDRLAIREPQILSLMTRIDFGDITYLEKQHRYYQYVRYWRGVLDKLKPDLVVFHDVPHIVFDTVLAQVAKMLGIRTIFKRPLTSMRDRVAFFDDFYNYHEVDEEYERLKSAARDENDLSEETLKIYDDLRNLDAKSVPLKYAAYSGHSGKERGVEVLPNLGRVARNIRQFTFFKRLFDYARLLVKRQELCSITKQSPRGLTLKWRNIAYKKIRERFRREYQSLHNENPDLSVPYVYFPLNRQPEATTNPMGGIFNDQILATDLLAAALPAGWKLYVKEHRDQWTLPLVHTGRYPGYYETMGRHENVELISVDISGFDLIKNARAVATVAGSTAMEAVVKDIPALIFGYPMYAGCEGMIRVHDSRSCEEAIRKIAGGYVPDRMNVLRFFQALLNVSVGAFIHKRHGAGSQYSYEESLKHMADGLYQACLKK